MILKSKFRSIVFLSLISIFTMLIFNSGCDDGGGGGVPSTGGGSQPGIAEKQLIIEGPIPDEIAQNTAVMVPDAPAGANRSVEFGDSKEFSIAVIDRDDPALDRELAPVVVETSESSLYRYKYRTVINIGEGRKIPFITIKSKILNKVVLSCIPGQAPAYSDIPKEVKKIYVKGVLIDSKSTARAVLANDNKMEISVPLVTLTGSEGSQEVVLRVLGAGDRLPADTVIENKSGAGVISEMAKAVDAIKAVLITNEMSAAEKSAIFENTREKLVVPSAAGVISDYVLTLKNLKVQRNAAELGISASIDLNGTRIDGRSTVAVIDGGAGNIGGASDNEPPTVTSVVLTPKTVRVGDELQLSFTTSRLLIVPPVVVINDRTVEAVRVDTNTYKAVTSVLGSDPQEVTFKIGNLVGENGKKGADVTELTDGVKPKVEEGVTTVQPPVFDPPAGIYKNAKIVSIYSKTPGCEIYYTLDGGEPSPAYGTRYESPVTLASDTTVKAVAVFNGISSIVNNAPYLISIPKPQVESPVFSFAGGSFSRAQSVTISCATAGASIRYTTDGTLPTQTNGALYSGAIAIDKRMSLKAAAFKDGMLDSAVTAAFYDVNIASETAPAPVFNPAPGAFISKQSVAIVSAVEGALIKYTLDGSAPSYNNGFVYSEPLVIMEPVTVKAVVIKEGMNDSAAAAGFFDVNIVGPVLEEVAVPVFSPQEGKYTSYNEFKVKIITQVKDAKIIYTTDGTTPGVDNGEIYAGPITINRSIQFKAVAVKDKMLDSRVITAFYEIRNDNAAPAPPVISGVKDGAITPYEVSLTWNEQEGVSSAAQIIFNNQASQYSKNSILTAEGAYTLEVLVRKTANNTTNRASAAFVIDRTPPVVPAVIGIGTDEISARPVIFYWQDALWTQTTAKLIKKGGLKADYAKGYEITENGSYILEITAVNEKNGLSAVEKLPFKIDSSVPEVPYISGIADSSQNASEVAADWEDIEGVTLTAELIKNSGEASLYIKKTPIDEDGSYVLTLKAKKNDTGTQNKRSISFVIDKAGPAAPLVSGIQDGALTSSEVRITWDESDFGAPLYGPNAKNKIVYRAEILKDGGEAERYIKNSVISSPGSYAVTVTAIKPNGLKKSKIIKFKIDKDAPDTPFITVADEGGASVVSWEELSGVSYSAKLVKDGGEAVDYKMKTPVNEKGVYTVTVTARRNDNGVVSSAKANFNRLFTDLVVGPRAVEIIGVENNAVVGKSVKIEWVTADGTTTSASIKKNGGKAAVYEKGSPVNEEGVYIVEVEAVDSFTKLTSKSFVTFTIDKTAAPAPVISGITEGAITASEVKVSWNEQAGVETTAKLFKNTSSLSLTEGVEYEKNSAINEEGVYTLEVYAKKTNNSMVATSKVSFTVDKVKPDAPVISGIENKSVTAMPVKLSWQEVNGNEYSAKLYKNQGAAMIYKKDSEVSEEGAYVFEVTAKKISNGLSSVSSLSFTIDKTVPEIPVITGVKEGDILSSGPSISWEEKAGESVTALISKNGGEASEYLKGSAVEGDGSYSFTLTVKNNTTGVSNKKTIKFSVDSAYPDAPVISGVKDGSVNAGTVYVSWEAREDYEYNAVVTPEGGRSYAYVKGSPIAADGKYIVKVTAVKKNGLSKDGAVNFEIDNAVPLVPVVKFVDKGAGQSVLEWPEAEGVKISAKIKVSSSKEFDYEKGAIIKIDDESAAKFSLVITALKERNGLSSTAVLYFNRTPAGFDAGPDYPIITGVNNGGNYSDAVSASWESVSGVSYYALLKKDGGDASIYEKNTRIIQDGSYILEVIAEKALNGLKNKAAVSFKIDTAAPAKPVITGLDDELDLSFMRRRILFDHIYMREQNQAWMDDYIQSKRDQITRDVVLSWREEAGVVYSAVISKNGGTAAGYGRGTLISASGKYVVEVTALKLANQKTAKESVSFTIDREAPAPPVVSGVEDGAVTPHDVTIKWEAAGDTAGVSLQGFISRNGGSQSALQNGAVITEDGEYALEVKAVRALNGSTAKTLVKFTINKAKPVAPAISGITDGAYTAGKVQLNWNEQEGVTTRAKLIKTGGNEAYYTKDSVIEEEGEYSLTVEAVKNSTGLSNSAAVKFVIDRTAPSAPLITGVAKGSVTAGPVKLSWNDQQWCESSARLTKNGGLKIEYIKNYELSEEGAYTLEVSVKNTRNSLTSESAINFTIDSRQPELPEITGVSESGIYGYEIKPFWNEIEGVTLGAKLFKNGGVGVEFKKGTPVSESGSYALELSAKKNSTGVSASKKVNFTINTDAPAAPVITGIAEGAVSAVAVKLSWQEVSDIKYSAGLSKNGGNPELYSKNSAVAENGSYVLTVKALKANGLSSSSKLSFTIDMNAPEVPIVSVKDEDGKSYVSWSESEGIVYTAKISKDGGAESEYVKGSAVSEKGNYIVTVTAKRSANGLETKASVAFNRDAMQILVAPEAPQVRGIEDGAVSGFDVSLTWQDLTSVITGGRIKKDGGEFVDYKKGTAITEDGSYIFELEVKEPKSGLSSKRTISFTIDKKAPAAPIISGVKDGETAGGELKLSWNDQDGCETTARITKSGTLTTVQNKSEQSGNGQNADILRAVGLLMMYNGDKNFYRDADFSGKVLTSIFNDKISPILKTNRQLIEQIEKYITKQSQNSVQLTTTTSTQSYIESPYEKYSSIIENGEYILEVTAQKKYNGLKTVSRVKFTLDQNEPDAPALKGIDNNAVTSENVTITWEKSEGVNYLAKLFKDEKTTLLYESGSPITIEGSYYLEVTAINKSNGRSSSASIKFKIDRSVPAVPVIIGVKDGGYTAEDITASWQDEAGISSSAVYTRDGSKETVYKKGEKFSEEGYYTLKLTVKNDISGVSNSKTIGFTIDRKAPDVPEFAGFTNGAVYSAPVKIFWPESSGMNYKAEIKRDNDATGDYSKGVAIIDDGSYEFTLSAVKMNGLSNSTTAVFIIDKTSPAAPLIDLINKTAAQQQAPSYGGTIVEKSPLNGPTVVSWNEQQGCSTTATLAKDGGLPAAYDKNAEISEEGKYVIEVTAKKLLNGLSTKSTMRFSRMADGFYSGPLAPKVSGALEGAVSAKAVTLSWPEEDGVAYYALLEKDGGNPFEFKNGSLISKDGKYSLEVKAEKKSNGLTNRSKLSFTIDNLPPDMPAVEGVKAEAVYATGVKASWKEAPGVFYSSHLYKDDEPTPLNYGNGYPINENGCYRLIVQAVKMSNNLDSKTEINFTIDQTPPAAPVISGAEEGVTVSSGVKISWTEILGVTTKAFVIKDNGNPQPLSNGAFISANASYRVELNAQKKSNGLKSASVLNFTINADAPAKPVVTGVASKRGYTAPVSANWEDQRGAVIKALLYAAGQNDPVEYIKGTPISYNGLNRLVVTARSANGLTNITDISFMVNTAAPPTPALSVLAKEDGVYVTWAEDPAASYSAKLSKKGGQQADYSKSSIIKEDGEYMLEITATAVYNNSFEYSNPLTSKASIAFTKEGAKAEAGPPAPQITGAVNGAYYNKPVTLSWNETDGVTTSATLTKFGSAPAAFEKGASVSEDGSYVLEVSAAAQKGGLAAKSSVSFVIDTTRPSVSLSYSANPAGEGIMRITASYSELPADGSTVKISIDQPGSEDIKNAAMTRDKSAPAVWYYDYYVNAFDGSKYIDGIASVSLSEVLDPAGNAAHQPSNESFTINTSSPAVSLSYAFVPAVPRRAADGSEILQSKHLQTGNENQADSNIFREGKLIITAVFSKDVKNGVTPGINIITSGLEYIRDQKMSPSNNRRVWTYEYSIKPDNGCEYIDGDVTVSISQVADEFGKIFSQPSNRHFTIDTRQPSVWLSYSANPARPGKLTITAEYSEPLAEGYIPYISIFQQGSYELTDTAMSPGATNSVWTYDYFVKTGESGEYADGRAVVVLSSVTDPAGNISKRPNNQTFLLGTKIPNYAKLSFSANPAGAGKMRITASFNEEYEGAKGPRISIDQPGKADVQQKWMEPGADKKTWYYDYVINDNNGSDFMDGDAFVGLIDEKGTAIDIVDGNTFVIDTTPPVVSLRSLNSGGYKMNGGYRVLVKWSASDSNGMPEKPVTISFYNGLSWATVEADLENTGSYNWLIPSLDISTGKISVSVVDKVGNRATAASAEPFTIISSSAAWSPGYPKIEKDSDTSVKLTLKVNRYGTAYYIVVPASAGLESVPSENVINGAIEGVTLTASGIKAIETDTELSLIIKNLPANAEYSVFVVVRSFSINQKEPALLKISLKKAKNFERVGGGGFNNTVYKVISDGRGNIYAGGSFTKAALEVVNDHAINSNVGTAINRIAKWDGQSWSGLGDGVTKYANVITLAADSKGNIYAGGYFTEIGGVKVNCIAKWDGAKWSSLGNGIGFDDNNKAGIQRYTNVNGYVNAIACDSKDNVYVGGYFNLAEQSNGDCIAVNYFAKWDGAKWSAVGEGAVSKGTTSPYKVGGNVVYSVAIDKNDNVYIGGAFNYAAYSDNGKYIAKWDGTKWNTLGTGMDNRVIALKCDNVGNLYAGGWFKKAGGVDVNYIAKWNGSSWEALGSGFDSWVYDIAIDSKGVLYASGSFRNLNGVVPPADADKNIQKYGALGKIAKWNGSEWSSPGVLINDTVLSMAVDTDDSIYTGGFGKYIYDINEFEMLLPYNSWYILKINP